MSDGLEIDDAAEAGNEMGVLDLDAVEAEIREIGKGFRVRLARQIAPAGGAVVRLHCGAHQHHASALQGIARFALIDHQRYARVGLDILGVHRKLGDEEKRRSAGVARDINQ